LKQSWLKNSSMPATKLPALPSVKEIQARLTLIFPDGLVNRGYLIREMAARTVYVFLYAGAIEGTERWIRPSNVYLMTSQQADQQDPEARKLWFVNSTKSKYRPEGTRWYADNSREPLRDETLRQGFIPTGAVVSRPGIPVTASTPRYALELGFCALFDPNLLDAALAHAIDQWQVAHLSKGALARLALVSAGAGTAQEGSVLVTFPNGETRSLSTGVSATISQAVIEQFAPRFLRSPAVIWLSESGNKVVSRDDKVATAIGFKIDQSKALPDIILVDMDAPGTGVLVVFVEVVATDGPVNEQRKDALAAIATDAGFNESHLAYVTAFTDRSASAYRKCVSDLAWHSFVWFASEPDHLVVLRAGTPSPIATLN